jgi:hypothetical protein
MSKSRPREARIITALKQVEARHKLMPQCQGIWTGTNPVLQPARHVIF